MCVAPALIAVTTPWFCTAHRRHRQLLAAAVAELVLAVLAPALHLAAGDQGARMVAARRHRLGTQHGSSVMRHERTVTRRDDRRD